MKRLISMLVMLSLALSLLGCQGNFGQIDLQDDLPIPENGVIERQVLEQIKAGGAIAVFTGSSNGFDYEWTIFGSDIAETKDINLLLDIEDREAEGLGISFAQTEAFGFPALLSIHLKEKWDAQSAAVYQNGETVYSVSVTGTKETILNISVDAVLGECVILPAALPVDATIPETGTEPSGEGSDSTGETEDTENYLSAVQGGDNRVYSDGSATGQDKYLTDPVPEGKPMPVEPEDQEINNGKTYTCTFSIECSTILNNLEDLEPGKREMVPADGVILRTVTVTFYEGESVYDVLQRVCREKGIHMEASWTPIYNSAYVEGIHNLYEFDCGSLSGWMYRVNGWYPNYGCSRYQLAQGDVVEWRYTCDLGKDVGCTYLG